MAATLTITDGTNSISLLTAKTAFQLRVGGWNQSDPPQSQIRRKSAYAEGSGLILTKSDNVFDEFTVLLKGTSHDNFAATLQTLLTLQREAREFHTTNWQKTPVYLQAQTKTETNTRYALLFDIRISFNNSLYDRTFENSSLISSITITVEREPYWRSHLPGVRPAGNIALAGCQDAPGTQADTTRQFVGNMRDNNSLTHIYCYDSSLITFSSNLINSTLWDYFVVSGSTPALNDIVYFGSTDGPFKSFVMFLSITGNFSATTTWEYWNGASWSSTAGNLIDISLAGGVSITNLYKYQQITGCSDWATTAINGVTAYWVRVRISAFTSWTTSPRQGGQVVYAVGDNYLDVPSTTLDGDADALVAMQILKPNQLPNPKKTQRIVMGLRSHDLSLFTSWLNFGGSNPVNWSTSLGVDASLVADPTAPGGNRVDVSFNTNTSLVTRATVSTNQYTQANAMEGTYNAYLLVQMTSGGVGDVGVALGMWHTTLFTGETVKTTVSSGGIEALNMGRITILGPRIMDSSNETGANNLQFYAKATRYAGAAALRIYALVLIPVDEWSLVTSVPSIAGTELDGSTGIECDGGIIRKAVTHRLVNTTGSPSGWDLWPTAISTNWQARGELPHWPPDKELKIYFLIGDHPTAAPNSFIIYPFDGLEIRSWAHKRWVFMRGAE